MALSNVLERLGRAVFESPFGSNRLTEQVPELAEIRLAVIDAVQAKSHRVSGRSVFPYDRIRVALLGVPEEQAAIFQGDFLARYFSDEVKTALKRGSYRFPEELAVEFAVESRLPLPEETWFSVETGMRKAEAEGAAAVAHSSGLLVVKKGAANHKRLSIEKAKTNIGRTLEVYRAAGPSRRNDLAFLGEGEVENTVSREHAHILRAEAKGEYRLFNDRSYRGEQNCGLWIIRDGTSLPVHRSARGTLLRAGDELHIGDAVVVFSIVSEDGSSRS